MKHFFQRTYLNSLIFVVFFSSVKFTIDSEQAYTTNAKKISRDVLTSAEGGGSNNHSDSVFGGGANNYSFNCLGGGSNN